MESLYSAEAPVQYIVIGYPQPHRSLCVIINHHFMSQRKMRPRHDCITPHLLPVRVVHSKIPTLCYDEQ